MKQSFSMKGNYFLYRSFIVSNSFVTLFKSAQQVYRVVLPVEFQIPVLHMKKNCYENSKALILETFFFFFKKKSFKVNLKNHKYCTNCCRNIRLENLKESKIYEISMHQLQSLSQFWSDKIRIVKIGMQILVDAEQFILEEVKIEFCCYCTLY